MSAIFTGFISNVAILLALSTVFNYLTRSLRRTDWLGSFVGGLAFGLVAVAGMTLPVPFAEGVIYDGRSIVLSLAGYFGGWVVAGVAAALAAAYRLWLGGSGALAGVATILSSAALGAAYRTVCMRQGRCSRPGPLLLMGVVVHLVMLGWQYVALPPDLRVAALQTIALPVMVIFPLATLATGLLLADQERRILEAEALESLVQERTRALQEAQETLVRNERLATIGQLGAGMAHELRNPLGVITNAVYLLESTHQNTPEKEREYLRLIRTQVEAAKHMVNDLLELARPRDPERHPASLVRIVREAVDSFALPERVELHMDLPEEDLEVHVDALQIQQVILNLLSNAVQAMPEEGELTLSVLPVGNEVHLQVRDTGCGITPQHAERIFEPLFTTKTRGFGLGLSISKRLVEANQGRIWFEQPREGGTAFWIALPRGPHGRPSPPSDLPARAGGRA